MGAVFTGSGGVRATRPSFRQRIQAQEKILQAMRSADPSGYTAARLKALGIKPPPQRSTLARAVAATRLADPTAAQSFAASGAFALVTFLRPKPADYQERIEQRHAARIARRIGGFV